MLSNVTLRPLKSEDIDSFLKWAGDPEVTQPLFWDHYKDRQSALRFLQDVVEKHRWFMAICLNNVPVGAVTLDQRLGSASCRAELGYVLAKGYWGKGITSKAVKMALEQGFADLGILRIEALVDIENLSSIRVLEKSGMFREAHLKKYLIHRGMVRDRYVYAKTV